MAHLSREGTDDRGQIILVAAVVLAVTFVGLALVVNSAIFSENLATRGDVPGSSEALDYRYEVEQGVGEIMETVNANETAGETELRNSVQNISAQGGFQQARSGRVVEVSYVDEEDGIRLAQDAPGELSSTTTSTLAEDIDEARNFQLNFTEDISGAMDNFKLIVEEDTTNGTFWNMTVDQSAQELEIEINDTSTATAIGPERCALGSNTPLIDVTGATVDGETCQALVRNGTGEPFWFAAGIQNSSGYEIRFEEGDNYNGTYSLIVDDGATAVDATKDYDVLYSVTVELNYRTSQVRYETEIEVAPGEVPP